MMDSKHTPGPWRVSGVSMQTGNISVSMEEHRIVIAEVTNAASFGDMIAGAMRRGGGSFDQGDCHTQMSNARLIAAAPDLLSALMECEAYFDNRADADCDQDGYIPNEEMKLLSEVRDAIAKATS